MNCWSRMCSSSKKSAPPPITTLEAQQVEHMEIPNVVGNRNTNGNGNRNTNRNNTGSDAGDGTNNRTGNLPKCAICPLCLHVTADCWELDKNKKKDMIIGRVWSNKTCWGQVSIKSRGFVGWQIMLINILSTTQPLLLIIIGPHLLAKSKS